MKQGGSKQAVTDSSQKQPQQIGTLLLKVIQAKLTRNTETVGKMDPYCTVTLKDQKFQTNFVKNAVLTPQWNEEFELKVHNISDEILLQIMDKDWNSGDDIVC